MTLPAWIARWGGQSTAEESPADRVLQKLLDQRRRGEPISMAGNPPRRRLAEPRPGKEKAPHEARLSSLA